MSCSPERVAELGDVTVRCSHFLSGSVKLVVEHGPVSFGVVLTADQVAVLFTPTEQDRAA